VWNSKYNWSDLGIVDSSGSPFQPNFFDEQIVIGDQFEP